MFWLITPKCTVYIFVNIDETSDFMQILIVFLKPYFLFVFKLEKCFAHLFPKYFRNYNNCCFSFRFWEIYNKQTRQLSSFIFSSSCQCWCYEESFWQPRWFWRQKKQDWNNTVNQISQTQETTNYFHVK